MGAAREEVIVDRRGRATGDRQIAADDRGGVGAGRDVVRQGRRLSAGVADQTDGGRLIDIIIRLERDAAADSVVGDGTGIDRDARTGLVRVIADDQQVTSACEHDDVADARREAGAVRRTGHGDVLRGKRIGRIEIDRIARSTGGRTGDADTTQRSADGRGQPGDARIGVRESVAAQSIADQFDVPLGGGDVRPDTHAHDVRHAVAGAADGDALGAT